MMRTHRGIVCEKKSKYTVFLTDKGDFLRGIPISEIAEIGDEVDFHLLTTPSRRVKPRLVGAIMVAAVLLISIVASMISMNDKVMAYVQVETDTALEFGVNQRGKVISLRYLNETASENENSLVKSKDYTIHTLLDTAMKGLSENTSDMQVIITTIYPNSKSQQKVQEIIGNAVQEFRTEHIELDLEIAKSTVEERVAANKKKMSIYKFKMGQQASPRKEKKPKSSNVDPNEKIKIENKQPDQEKVTPKSLDRKANPAVPSNEKKNMNEKPKEIDKLNNSESRQPKTRPNTEQGEKVEHTPTKKPKPANPASKNKNPNKGNPNPDSNKSNEKPKDKPKE